MAGDRTPWLPADGQIDICALRRGGDGVRRLILAPPIENATLRNWPGTNVKGRKRSLEGGRRRNVFTLGVSVTMFPTRRCPRQFEVTGGAAETSVAGGARVLSGGFESSQGGAGARGFGVPPPGGGVTGGAGSASVSIRPNKAAARRILKKYIAIIASAKTTSIAMVKR